MDKSGYGNTSFKISKSQVLRETNFWVGVWGESNEGIGKCMIILKASALDNWKQD